MRRLFNRVKHALLIGSSRSRQRTLRPSLALGMEVLEDRRVLSTFTVLNLDDAGLGSLRQAVEDANALEGADLIRFAHALKGTVGLTSGELAITDDLTIDGPGAQKLTISGNPASRVFSVFGSTVTIADLTIADGVASDVPGLPVGFAGGGGLLNLEGRVTVTHVDFTGNQTLGIIGEGGGIANFFGASLEVSHSNFTDNVGFGAYFGAGGAIASNVFSTVTVDHSSFEGNVATASLGGNPADIDQGLALGGAIAAGGGTQVTVTHSDFRHNVAKGSDGTPGTGQPGAFEG